MTAPAANNARAIDATTAERFRRDFDRLSPAFWDSPIIVAVSGGADSMALLLLLHDLVPHRCRAATVDHGLRPESADEAAMVARQCAERGIPHRTLRGALPDRAAGSANVSARARLLRYRLLDEHATAEGAGCIATAHHADDQIETLMMRLNRGSGVAGLAGIRAENGRIIRPLLAWRRRELESIVANAGIAPVDDPTNRDDRFDRARLRKVLATADWLDVDSAARSARLLAEADAALDWTVAQVEDRFCTCEEGKITMLAVWLPVEVKRRLVARCVARIDPDARPRGSALARVVDALDLEERITIGDVLCDIEWFALPGEGKLPVWRFRPAPPRRSG